MRKQDIDLCAMEREYIAGASTYELGEKYGVRHETVSKWMRGLGHCRGRHQGAAFEKSRKLQGDEALARFAEAFADMYRGEIEYVGGFGGGNAAATFRCCRCGHMWERKRPREVLRMRTSCPACKERERLARAAEEELRSSERQARTSEARRKRAEREAKKEAKKRELDSLQDTSRACRECGTLFKSRHPEKVYCSDKCNRKAQRRKTGHDSHRKRARKYGTAYDPSVNLHELFERDSGICQICGEPCDWTDVTQTGIGKRYPTIDHVVAMSVGGGHTWDNVQLACMLCNSKKGASVA